jgi:hypothetical protein
MPVALHRILTVLVGGSLVVVHAADAVLTVAAGSHDRRDAVVPFAMPVPAGGGHWRLRGGEGELLAVQSDPDGQASFVLPALAKGQQRTLTLEPAPVPAAEQVELVRDGDALSARVAGRELVRYQGGAGTLPPGFAEEFRRGGYLARLCTPSGIVVTDDYPPKHQHHHAVWFSWTKTVFDGRHPDFWNMGQKTGTVEAVAIGRVASGTPCAGFVATHRYVDLTSGAPVPVLGETWTVTVHAPLGSGPALLVDLTVGDRAVGDKPLTLPVYHYGGLGLRGHRQWDGAQGAQFLTSEGRQRADGNETRGRWCRMSGLIDGKAASIAVLGHPGNFRAPQPMRLHPNEPFFCFAPSQLGDWEIAPATPLTLRYRLVVADGVVDAAELDRLWNDYAEPPLVTAAP